MRTYDAKAVAVLDRRYSTAQVIDQRRRIREIIGARTGEVGLDVVADRVSLRVNLPLKWRRQDGLLP